MKSHQIHDLIIRLSTAAGVALTMLVTVHALGNISQQHIERQLAQFATANADVVQLATHTAAKQA